jgi:GTP-binding protein
MLRNARALDRRLDTKIPTAKLNATIIKLADRTPPHAIGGQRFKIYYATQTSTRPFRIKVFCNQERSLTESYRRYLEAGLVKEFELDGCPIHFDLVGKKKMPIEQRLAYRKSRVTADGGKEAGADGDDFDPSLMDD